MKQKYSTADLHHYRCFVDEVNRGSNRAGASAEAEILVNNLRLKVTVEGSNPFDCADILLRGLGLIRGTFDREWQAGQ